MSYKTTAFLNEQEMKLLNILKDNVKEKYTVLVKIRLSEFLYSTQPQGSDAFFDEFNRVNLVTLPFVIFDTLENRLAAVVYLSENGLEEKDLLGSCGIPCIEIGTFRDVLTSEKLAICMV